VEVYNLYEGEVDVDEPDEVVAGFCTQAKRFGPLIGASMLGATVYVLDPGESICPYHYEYPIEEWLLVVTGRPTLRDADGEHELEPGDVVCFPEGPGGAHQVFNRTAETLRVVMLSTKEWPNVAVYPDSDKIGVWPAEGNRDDQIMVRRSSRVDYYDGELPK
jgi:uncharacterized cupin superfamily protein